MKESERRFLRSLILEQVEELFAQSSAEEESEKIEKSSADDQIDAFLLKYERDSMGDEDEDVQGLSESLNHLSLKALLLEQEDDESAVEAVEATEESEAEPEAKSEEKSEDDEKPDPEEKSPKPPIDIDAFTKRVARLAMNFENLIDMKVIIVNRATNFLSENYDESKASEMRDLLDTQFDFDLTGGKEIPSAPYAAGAFQGGTGALGGGG